MGGRWLLTRVAVAALACAIGGTIGVAVASADNGAPAPDVISDEATYTFADRMSFGLSASVPTPVDDVVLRYTVGAGGPINRRIPVFEPGSDVEAAHVEDLVRGEIPPASEITWWWALTDTDGLTYETEPRSVRYLDERFDWQSRTEGGFRVWWYGDMEPIAEQVGYLADAVMEHLERIVGSAPDRQIEIVVYESQADLRPALAQRGETYESRLATLGARVAPDVLVLDAGTSDDQLGDVIAHELSHMVLNLHIGRDYISVPLWLDEGLAMYAEGPLDEDEQAVLDEAIASDSLMSIRSLTSFPGEAELVPLAYAESRDVVAYLIETGGQDRFLALLDVLSAGEATPDEALTEVYGHDQLSLYQAYRADRGLAPASAPPDEAGDSGRQRPPRRVDSGDGGGPACPAALLLLPALAVLAVATRGGRTLRKEL